jgi:hypothetical protein
MEIDKETLTVLRAFNRNVDWLKVQALKSAPPEKWGSFDDAVKILKRSRHWYNRQRREFLTLEVDKDWRMVGSKVEYRMESIARLKERITK